MRHSILVIDGEREERAILCTAIREKLNYHVFETDGDIEARQFLASAQKKPDIILYDMSRAAQPYEKIAGIRTAQASAPVIVLTKYGDYGGAMKAINAGAQDFLTKPVAVERMSITFRNILILRNAGLIYGSNANNIMVLSMLADDGNIRRMHEIEKEAIRHALQRYDGCMTEVARRLGIGRSTLYRKLQDGRVSETA